MEENMEFGKDELLEWARLNNINMTEKDVRDIIEDGVSGKEIDALEEYIDLDKFYAELNSGNAIGEYENFSKKMKAKINKLIKSLEEKDEKELEEETDRDEKDTLDEKEGKEELTKEKKEEVEKKKEENGKETKDKEEEEKDKPEVEVKEDKENEAKTEEELSKAAYLARVKKLHEMRLVEYKDELKKDDVKVDRHFTNMIYLQRGINRDRQNYVKKFGEDGIKELAELENKYVKKELEYEKAIYTRHQKDIARLHQLDQKLDKIMDKMESLQNALEDKHIDSEDYAKEIESLEKDKLDTLWQINKLNPELIQQKQDRNIKRDEYERIVTSKNMGKIPENNLSKENNKKMKDVELKERKQEGVAGRVQDNMLDNLQNDIDEKEKRLDELKAHLKDIDISTSKGKEEAKSVINEIYTLQAQQKSSQEQAENLETNMKAGVADYSDIKSPETERVDDTEKMQDTLEDIGTSDSTTDFYAQLVNQTVEDPDTPEQADEYMDNMEKIAEDAKKEQEEKEETREEDEGNEPSLFNRRKRPF